ncbi:dehydrogenase/reductase 11 [Phyllostomus discolor]|nr:dehydrogenase/reductase 11 [Phyllostomus discolor]
MKVGPASGLGAATLSEGRRTGTLAFRPHPLLWPVALPGGLGWDVGAGENLSGGRELAPILSSSQLPFPRCSQCLKPEDVAEAVLYVLSTPPHVQIGDIQMRPTEQVT